MTDEMIAYQQALYVVASAAAEKVRRRGGSPREMAEAFDAVRQLCGWPEPRAYVEAAVGSFFSLDLVTT